MSNTLAAYIPHFLALSARAVLAGPGHGSCLEPVEIFEQLPTAGCPTSSAVERVRGVHVHPGGGPGHRVDPRGVVDVRPHPNFGTVELRICDGLPTLSEVAAIGHSASVSSSGWTASVTRPAPSAPRQWSSGRTNGARPVPAWRAEIIVDEDGDLVPVAAPSRTSSRNSSVAEKLHCTDELRSVLDILRIGPSYVRSARLPTRPATCRVVDALVASWRRTPL